MAVEVGREAPDFTLKSADGEDVSLSDLRGRNVVLVFYPLAFSGGCTKQLTSIGTNEARYAGENAQVVAVSVDSRHAARAFAESIGLKDTIMLADFEPKGEVARMYGAFLDDYGYSTRASFVIDGDGIVRSAVVNSPADIPDEEEYFKTLAVCNA